MKNFEEMMIMIDAASDAAVAVDIATNYDWRPHDARLRLCADKFAADCAETGQELPLAYQVGGLAPDNTEDEVVIPPISKSRSRKQRRRAEELRKARYELLWRNPSHNDTIKRITHGDKTAYIKGGDKYPWKKMWRRMNHRALREDGKRMCREEWDVTDFVTDFSATSVNEEVTVEVSEIGVPEMPVEETSIPVSAPDTHNNIYMVTYYWCYDFDYTTDKYVVEGWEKAVAFYNNMLLERRDDEEVCLFTTHIDERGLVLEDKLIAGEG